MEFIRLEGNLDDAVARARDVLRQGGIVVYPTDTLYGLAVDAHNPTALSRLRELKGRGERKPISVVVRDVPSMEGHAQVSDVARAIAARHLPGPLTLVLPARESIPRELALDGALRIRIPDDPFALSLAEAFGRPYTSTSANLSGLPTPETPLDILKQFGLRTEHIDLVIDDGPRAGGVASTVLRLVEETPFIVREGAITREELGI